MTHTSDRAEVVTAQFDWQRSEVAQALRQIARLRPQSAWRRRLPVLLTIMLAAAGLFLIVGVMTKGSAALVGSLPWIAVLAAWLVLFRGGAAWLTAWQMSRNNPHMLSGQTHVMNASGYAVACGGTSSSRLFEGNGGFVHIGGVDRRNPFGVCEHGLAKADIRHAGIFA